MTVDRDLDWDGCYNARDLGGLRTAGGGEIRWGAVVRSASPRLMTGAGWSALWEHGVRTIIDLTNDDERQPDNVPRPAEITTLHWPLDPVDDTEFWDSWSKSGMHGTPLYYQPYLDRYPQRLAPVIASIAQAPPGGVLVHCGIGRDRTGLIILVLLALAGVSPEDIAADHALSHARLRPLFAKLGADDQHPIIEKRLIERNTTAHETLLSTLASVDIDARLRSGGLSDHDLTTARARLLDQPPLTER
jgi:protein-tyrosine phosphatase